MKKQSILTAAMIATVLLFFSQSARAGYFKDRQREQKTRIERGISRGQITPREAETLYGEQRRVRQLAWYFLADGKLTEAEYYVLIKRMDRSSDLIYRYKHNHRQAKPRRHGHGSHGFHARR